MVLKKNDRQITFLHLYHHSSIFLFWNFIMFLNPGGCAYSSAILNSFIHILMYGYYFAASIKINLLPIKKYMTMMQMIQFFILFSQSSINLYDQYFGSQICYCNQKLTWTLWFYMISMVFLFANFFINDRKREKQLKTIQKNPRKVNLKKKSL